MARFDRLELINAVGELAGLLGRSSDTAGFLSDVVDLVARTIKADVSSIYLHDALRDELILRATHGLNPEFVGTLSLRPGEGLTGRAFEEGNLLTVSKASAAQGFKPIPHLGEEAFEAFLAAPIRRGPVRIGVMTLQHREAGYFDERDGRAMRAVTGYLAQALENASLLYELSEERRSAEPALGAPRSGMFDGAVLGKGIAQGKSIFLQRDVTGGDGRTPESVEEELDRFSRSVSSSLHQLEELQRHADEIISDLSALVFSAHLLMLRDSSFTGRMRERIEAGESAEAAVHRVVSDFVSRFEALPEARFQEKALDVRDLGHRLQLNLSGAPEGGADYGGRILIIRELFPSELIKLAVQRAAGIILVGGRTSHIAILSQSLGIPVVASDEHTLLELPDETEVILDGEDGKIIVGPKEDVRAAYESRRARHRRPPKQEHLEPPFLTVDGAVIHLLANVNLVKDSRAAAEIGAEGIGLYRSEFPFLIRNDFPSEDEQIEVYRRVFEPMGRREITVRALDIGGDKLTNRYAHTENNPFLGFRGIRFLLHEKELFREQLRALLQSRSEAPLRVMFPMIGSLEEFQEAKELLREAKDSVWGTETPLPPVGAMIEVPSAIEVAPELAASADFLSLGTNDLTMYVLGVDRSNGLVGNLFRTDHPALLRATARLIRNVGPLRLQTTVCGESAGDPYMLLFYIGIGIRRFSVQPHGLSELAGIIEKVSLRECEGEAEELLNCATVREVEERRKSWLERNAARLGVSQKRRS